MKTILAISLTLSLTTPALAEDWKYVLTAPDNSFKQYVDRDNIDKRGSKVSFWKLTEYRRPMRGTDTTKALVNYVADCNTRRYIQPDNLYFNEYGQQTGRKLLGTRSPVFYAEPGSVIDKSLQYVCGY